MFLFILKVVFIVIVFYILKYLVNVFTNPIRNLPGPKSDSFLTGNVKEIRKDPFMQPHMKWWKACNYAPLMRYFGILGTPSLIVTKPELVKEILASQTYEKYPKKYGFIATIIGDGLVSLEGDEWKRHRKIVQPSFSLNFVKKILQSSVPKRAKQLSDILLSVKKDKPIDIQTAFTAITLDIIASTAFQFDGFSALDNLAKGWVDDPSKSDDVIPQVFVLDAKVILPSFPEMFFLGFGQLPPKFVASKPRGERIAELDRAVLKVIAATRDRATNINGDAESRAKSILELLLSAQADDALSQEEYLAEVKTFLFAGHETTSTLLTWCVYALLKNDGDWDEKMLNEINEVFGDEEINVDKVKDLKIMDAFINEVSRMYPSIGLLVRRAGPNGAILDGQAVRADTRIVIPIYMLHRHPELWHEPETFNPARWLSDEKPKGNTPWTFLPFGAGPRSCIGRQFALIEGKLILATLLRRLKFKLSDPKQEFTPTSVITVKPKPDLKVFVEARK